MTEQKTSVRRPPHTKAHRSLTRLENEAYLLSAAEINNLLSRTENNVKLVTARPVYAALARRYNAAIALSTKKREPLPPMPLHPAIVRAVEDTPAPTPAPTPAIEELRRRAAETAQRAAELRRAAAGYVS